MHEIIQLSQQQGVTIIRLGSSYDSLDMDALDELGSVLLTTAATVDPPKIVIDASQTSFIGSTFIEILVRAWKRLGERGGSMVLCGVQPFCAEVMRVTRLDTLWPTRATLEEAIAAAINRPSS
jgi:anti-sigma B factor antagonist